ncbi:MAG: LON peptidase substrate-binding domain-containing protein, partial [Agromyces sp.]
MAIVLPQFPVGSVVFPHTPVALRVFEPRYLALMGELMLSERQVFGMPLYGQTVEPGAAPEQLTIGTAVRVDDFGVTGEFMGIEATAEQRYVVTRWLEP